MFTSRNVRMEVARASLKTGRNDNNELTREAEISLVLDPLPFQLAREIDLEVSDHLFTDDDEIRAELENITLNPKVPDQALMVCGDHLGEVELCLLRNVKFGMLKVAKQKNEKTGDEWWKATVLVNVDLSVRAHREWLVGHFGEYLYFSFAIEQQELPGVGSVREATRNLQGLCKDGAESIVIAGPDGAGTRITRDNVTQIPPRT